MKESYVLAVRLRWQPSEIDALPEWERQEYLKLVQESMDKEKDSMEKGSKSPPSRPHWSR